METQVLKLEVHFGIHPGSMAISWPSPTNASPGLLSKAASTPGPSQLSHVESTEGGSAGIEAPISNFLCLEVLRKGWKGRQ